MKIICLAILCFATAVQSEDRFCRSPIEAAIQAAAQAEHISPSVLAGVCYKESRFHPRKVHHDDGSTDSYGLCQIKLELARALGYQGTEKGLLKADVNALFAAKALRYHQGRTHGGEEMIAAYNAGRVRRKGGVIRNIAYVRAVQANVPSFANLEVL